MANQNLKRCSNSFLLRKKHIKASVRHTPSRMAKMKKVGANSPIPQMRKLMLREAKTLVHARMPWAVCPQSLLSFCF